MSLRFIRGGEMQGMFCQTYDGSTGV